MQKTFLGLSGMPRSGSTLLSAILSQNPNIHSEGTSSLSAIMLENFQLLHKYNENFHVNKKPDRFFNMVSSLPEIYYSDVYEPIIIDKCRLWTTQRALYMMYNFITPNPKIVVMERPLIDVVKSFVNILRKNNQSEEYINTILDDGSTPIITALDGVRSAKAHNKGEFLFVQYDDLVNNPKDTIKNIYDFYEIEPFEHQFNNIICKHPEDDSVNFGFNRTGLHDIRPILSKQIVDIELSQDIIRKCEVLDIR